jgi:hypothetical protein
VRSGTRLTKRTSPPSPGPDLAHRHRDADLLARRGLAGGRRLLLAVSTLTTSSIADPDLALTSEAIKIFTAFYVLTGIGILVELARELGVGFIKIREEHHATRHTRRGHREDPMTDAE